MWSNYWNERFGWKTIEVESGFIVYDIKTPDASIEDLYVVPGMRGSSLAQRLADQVVSIARENKCTKLWLRVIIGSNGAEYAVRSAINYGFKLATTRGNDIIFSKDI